MWRLHEVAAIRVLERLDADDPCRAYVIRFSDALVGATDQQGAIAARLLEPVVGILATWPAPTTPHDDGMVGGELPVDLREALVTADAQRCVGSLLVLQALATGPDRALGRAYAAAAVDLYAGRANGLGWVSGVPGHDDE